MPTLLDVYREGRNFRYELLTANLHESYVGKQGPEGREHAHAVYHVVLYVGGRGAVSCAGRLHAVEKGSLVLVSPGMPHSFTPPGGEVCYHALTFALASGSRRLAIGFDELLGAVLGRPTRLSAVCMPDAQTWSALKREMEANVRRLLGRSADWLAHEKSMIRIFERLAALGEGPSNRSERLAERAKRVLEARFGERGFSLTALAEELHTAPEHLCRVFRREQGMTPVRYRNELRIRAARELLRNTYLPCKAIAERLGYSDVYAFSKAYRREAGCSPSSERVQ